MTLERVTSQDGTTIAFEKTGSGPVVILVSGALSDREYTRPLAEELSRDLTVINFDRRSRGDSYDAQTTFPVSADREIEDIEALVELVAEPVFLYGHSAGGALAFKAAPRVKPAKLVLHEAAFHPDDRSPEPLPDGFNQDLKERFEKDDAEGMVVNFFASGGMSDEQIEELKESDEWPGYVALGRSLAYDSAAIGDATGGRIPRDLLPEITCPTLSLAGSATYSSLIEVARAIADELPDATFEFVGGADHESGPDLIAPPIRDFLTA